jgi:large subunit ribosomal protein L10
MCNRGVFRRNILSLNRTEKAAVIEDVKAQVVKAQTLVMAEYRGTKVSDMTKLRKSAREQGVYLHVLKNTLARRAVAGTPFEVVSGEMSGPLIYGFSTDAVAAAKVINDFAKTNDKLVIRAGSFDGKALDKAGVAALASIPSREVLLAQIAGLLNSPVASFARVLAAVSAKKGGANAAEPAAEAAAA